MFRDALDSLLKKAGFITRVESPLEKRSEQDEGLRIDILAHPHGNGPALLIDITIFNSVAPNAEEKECMRELEKREEAKRAKYQDAAAAMGGTVLPVALDVYGATRDGTLAFLRGLVPQMKARVNADEAPTISFHATILPVLSRALAFGNGQCLLLSNKLPQLGIDVNGSNQWSMEAAAE